jgi:cobalt/nickel transport system permease protein
LTFNARGFYLAVVIILKATAIALMMEPLLATAPFPVTINALSQIGVPAKLCQMILLTHRYIFVFLHEARRMNIGMRVRGFRKKTDTETLKTIGNFLGMLFVRSYERTQRVYEAMLSRGYTGSFPVYTRFCASPKDRGFAFLWILLGVALILGDRILTVI